MAQSYTRQSTFADGDTITATLFNNEYNQLVNVFAYSDSSASTTGHRHDGTAAQGGNIPQIGDLDFKNKIVVDSTNNRWGVFVEVSGTAVEQIRIQDGAIVPVTDSDIDLGTSSLEFKDLFLDGTAHIDTLDVDVNATVAGTLGVTGATTLSSTLAVTGAVTGSSTIQGTTITATTAFVPDASDGASLGGVNLQFSDLFLADGALLAFGDDQDVTITHLADAGLLLNGARGLFFNDTTQYINAPSGTVLDIAATDEIELTATLIDINGAVDISGNLDVGGNLVVTGTTTFNGGTLTLGDAASDNVVFGADVNSSIIPNTDATFDLGSSSQEWRDLYVDGTAYVDAINFNGTAISATAEELNIMDGVTATTAELNIMDGVTSTTAEINILDGVTSTAAELNILDGVTSTAAEINLLDGVTSTTAELNILDGVTATAAEINILDGVTSTAAELNLLDGVTSTTAELNILDGVTATAADINLIDGITNGTVIASKAIITDANKDISGGRNITISGELDAGSLDISGDVDVDGTLEADAITIAGITLAETISDTVGAMVTSNTESGITVAYDDSDNTLDFTVGTLNQDTTGNAATATALETARTIGGTSFDGTANIAVALADTSTALATARTIGGVSFDGTANITPTTFTTATFSGDVNVDSGVLFADVSANRVGINQTSPDVSLDLGANTDAVHVPVGTTAQRPGSAAAGYFRYNTSLAQFEGYTDAWGAIGGGGTNTFTHDVFTCNGSTTAFALSQSTESENNLIVFIDGVFQEQGAYSIATSSGTTTLTLSAAPVSGRKLVVYSVAAGVSGSNLNIDSMTGDGSDTTLTLSINPVNENNTQVFIDGVYQSKSNYSISGTTLTFSTAPPTGSAVEVMTMTQTEVNVPVDGTITSAKLSGDLTLPGSLTFADSEKAIFGAGSDLQIYHDGSNSWVSDQGTGQLILESGGAGVYIQKGATETMANFVADGSVSLYHDNSKKFETTATGIDVTGSVTADGLTVEGNGTYLASLNNTAQDARIQLSREGTEFGQVSAGANLMNLVASGSSTDMRFLTNSSERMRITGATGNVGIGVAPSAANKMQVAVATNTVTTGSPVDSSIFNIQGGTTTVGDGVSLQLSNFSGAKESAWRISAVTVSGNNGDLVFNGYAGGSDYPERLRIDSSGALVLNNAGGDAQMYFGGTSGTTRMYLARSGSDSLLWNVSNGAMRFGTNDTERLRIDSAGSVGINNSNPSAFNALGGKSLVVGNGVNTSNLTLFSDDTADGNGYGHVAFADSAVSSSTAQYAGLIQYYHGEDSMRFYTNATQKMRIDASGILEVQHDAYDGMQRSLTLSNPRNAAGSGDGTSIYFNNTGTSTIARSAYIGSVSEANYGQSNALVFGVSSGSNAPTEAARIDSAGSVNLGVTTPTHGVDSLVIYQPDNYALYSGSDGTGVSNHLIFGNANSWVGSITTNGTATQYNTSSDQRLKENIVDAPSASDDIDAIQVRSFNWKADGVHQKYGMVAQELLEVAPEAVSAPEDSEEMMGVDYSKLVPMMLKEIQSLRARIAALES